MGDAVPAAAAGGAAAAARGGSDKVAAVAAEAAAAAALTVLAVSGMVCAEMVGEGLIADALPLPLLAVLLDLGLSNVLGGSCSREANRLLLRDCR